MKMDTREFVNDVQSLIEPRASLRSKSMDYYLGESTTRLLTVARIEEMVSAGYTLTIERTANEANVRAEYRGKLHAAHACDSLDEAVSVVSVVANARRQRDF